MTKINGRIDFFNVDIVECYELVLHFGEHREEILFLADDDAEAIVEATKFINDTPELIAPDSYVVSTLAIGKLKEKVQRNNLILFDSRDKDDE